MRSARRWRSVLRSIDAVPLDVVLVLNMQAETLKEEVAVGLAQSKVIADLRNAAEGTAHRLGIYYTVPATEGTDEPERATYIHSKIMIVDDRFLTVGSANLTNRSTCIDTELNVSMETDDAGDSLGKSITRARQSLIAEHLGIANAEAHTAEASRRHAERARCSSRRSNQAPSFTDRQRTRGLGRD